MTRRSILVVGASSGIGLAVAEKLSARGDLVTLVARDEQRLRAVAASLPGRCAVAPADVVDRAAVQAAVDTAVGTFGRLDGVVTTAQAMAYGTVEEVPPEVLDHMTSVAVTGPAQVVRAALPHLRAAGGGGVVVVSSLLAQVAVPSMGAYCAAKWGQLGLVRTLQGELRAERDLHVSLVLPGAIDTPIYRLSGTYAGREGSAPPPVRDARSVADACLARLERPRRVTHVGFGNRTMTAAFRVAPGLYDRLALPLSRQVALRGPASDDTPGNVFEPRPDLEARSGGWSLAGRRRDGRGRRSWRA